MSRLNSSFNKGLSLAETMLVMTLVMVLMGLMAGLMKEYSEILRTGRSQTARLELVQNALTRMAGEATEASEVTISDAEPFQTLTLKRLNPDPGHQGQRLPNNGIVETSWKPFRPADMINVSYRRDDSERLWRVSSDESLEVARDVSMLKMEKPDEFTLMLKLSTAQGRAVKTLSTRVYLFAVRP